MRQHRRLLLTVHESIPALFHLLQRLLLIILKKPQSLLEFVHLQHFGLHFRQGDRVDLHLPKDLVRLNAQLPGALLAELIELVFHVLGHFFHFLHFAAPFFQLHLYFGLADHEFISAFSFDIDDFGFELGYFPVLIFEQFFHYIDAAVHVLECSAVLQLFEFCSLEVLLACPVDQVEVGLEVFQFVVLVIHLLL